MARRTNAPVTKVTTVTRESRATSRKSTDPVAAGAPNAGTGLAEAIAIVTTVMLVAAILMTDYYLGKHLGSGVFFKP